MMADGFTRASGKMSMLVGQNGPGIANFVTPVKVAYWNHTPLLVITAQAANMTMGQGGFQEVPQMAMFEDMVAYQEEVLHPSRMAEVLNRVIIHARPAGGEKAIARAAELLSKAKFPVILNGGGVVIGGAIKDSIALAERLDAPVCCNYQHNDAFPGSHPLFVGPLGYNGSKAGMNIISKADVILALGNRLNPFSTLPCYGIEYTDAAIIQVDINPDRIGLTKPITVGIAGDAKKVANSILEQLSDTAGDIGRDERKATIEKAKAEWDKELATMDHEADDSGTTWNERCQKGEPEKITARMAWRAIIAALPKESIISSDIGNNCAIGNAYPTFEEGRKYLAPGMFGSCGYGFPAILGAKISKPDVPVVGFAGDGAFGISMNEMTACGRDEWPAITMVIFRNYQWGAEKRNTTLWYHDNFVGTELDTKVSYADIAKACGLYGVCRQGTNGRG